MSVQNSSKDLYYTDTDRRGQLGVATESEEASMDPVWNENFSQILYTCLTSLTRAKPKEKMEFPALFPHYA